MKNINNQIKKLMAEYSSGNNGLSKNQVQINRNKYGDNSLGKQKKESFFHKFLMQFKSLMIIVLLASAIISLSISIINKNYSDLFEGALILFIVIINSLIGALQEKKAENTLALLEKKASTKAKVIRDGTLNIIDFEEIVVGDIVELKTGDFVPADIRLFETNNLYCDESSLTGESKKIKKDADYQSETTATISDKKNICHKGTIITSGNAKGIVIKTGKDTEIGKIAKLISSSKKQKTPLEKNIDKIGKMLTIGVSIIVLIVFAVQLIFSSKINFGDAFMTAIALAVAAIPESLPAVITIIMALGVQKLAKHNAIVKTLSSVETLGCCTTICSDKTGTLTKNQMSVNHVFYSGNLYNENQITNSANFLPLFQISSLCSNAKTDENNNIVGDATEKALYNLCLSKGFDITKTRQDNKRIKEIPFSSSTKNMVTVNVDKNSKHTAYVKGAYDYLIDKCSSIYIDGKIINLKSIHKDQIEKAHKSLTSKAERVLMLAMKDGNTPAYTHDNLTFIALVGIIDPPRPEVYDAIKKCHKAGLKPIMITGDHKETAFGVAKLLGIAKSSNQVISGKELDTLDDTTIKKIISNYTVFARVTPEHKTRIVNALKSTGHIVAMTGDGVNDAPSIKQADIGTCMGITGTDVTKSVADLIISDDNFSTIVIAVKEGRTIYNNIRKTLQFLISTNAVEVLGLFVASIIMRDSIFLLPSQILFINLITDSLPAFALGIEPAEKDIMDKPPRNPKETIFSGEIGTAIIYQAFVQTLVVLILFVCCYHAYGNQIANTMCFITICLMQILHAVNCKTNKSLFSINVFANKFFNLSFIGLLILILLVSLVPSLQSVFSLVPLTTTQWLWVCVTSISIIPLVELFKVILPQKQRN